VLGGWASFVACVAVIGAMTMIIGDLARMFGCTIGLKDNISAITFLSIGTGLPGKTEAS
jgi:solute carrier family 8 (sodium/calcium exchanger)